VGIKTHQDFMTVQTQGRGTVRIDGQVQKIVDDAGIDTGLCTVFLAHTSASLILCENADPTVRADLERFFGRLVPDGDPLLRHQDEGPDDMPAHIRSILTQNSIAIPVYAASLTLGVWQGLYLWEHRTSPHARRVVVHIQGAV
jgi:secondary thiamine-phosphate synthase enzyme